MQAVHETGTRGTVNAQLSVSAQLGSLIYGTADGINRCNATRKHHCRINDSQKYYSYCRGGPVPDRLSAALISRKFAVARACVRGPSRQADVSAAG